MLPEKYLCYSYGTNIIAPLLNLAYTHTTRNQVPTKSF